MKKKIFYAVSKRGQGRVFTTKPERDENFGVWLGESCGCISATFMLFEADGMEVPDIKWKDDPVEFEISIGLP